MSIESAKVFFERMKNDVDFRNSVGEIATSEERIEYVKKAGFDFTMKEIATVKDELSDEELETVAGGSTPCSEVCNVRLIFKSVFQSGAIDMSLVREFR